MKIAIITDLLIGEFPELRFFQPEVDYAVDAAIEMICFGLGWHRRNAGLFLAGSAAVRWQIAAHLYDYLSGGLRYAEFARSPAVSERRSARA